MTDIAIRAENIGKRYKIGVQVDRYRTLRDTLVEAVRRPARMLRGGGIASNESDLGFERHHI